MQTSRYRSYLLRCWEERQATSDQPSVWRYSLEETGGGGRRGFTSLSSLLNFLSLEIGAHGWEDEEYKNKEQI